MGCLQFTKKPPYSDKQIFPDMIGILRFSLRNDMIKLKYDKPADYLITIYLPNQIQKYAMEDFFTGKKTPESIFILNKHNRTYPRSISVFI